MRRPLACVMLPHLFRGMVRSMLAASAIAGAVCVAAAAVRLFPWLLSASVPLSVATVFGRGLLFASLEVALLTGLPIGAALEACRWVADGSSLALRATGLSPGGQAAHGALPAAVLSACLLAVSWAWGLRAAEPGKSSNELIEAARTSACAQAIPARVPLLQMDSLCVHGLPTFVGAVPEQSAPQVAWSANDVCFSSDGQEVRLQGLKGAARTPPVRLLVATAHVRGLLAWPSNTRGVALLRAVASALCALGCASICGWLVLRLDLSSRTAAVLLAAVGPALYIALAPTALQQGIVVGLPAALALACLAPVLGAAASAAMRANAVRTMLWVRRAISAPAPAASVPRTPPRSISRD